MSDILPVELVPQIVEGEVVQLRSGGQKMTIEALNADLVACVWFEKGIVRRDQFPRHVLQRATDSHMILRINGLTDSEDVDA